MATELLLPKFGEVMEEGTVEKWLKKVGDRIEEEEIVLTVESEKAVMEVESPTGGTLKRIMVQEGETVPINTVLAYIG